MKKNLIPLLFLMSCGQKEETITVAQHSEVEEPLTTATTVTTPTPDKPSQKIHDPCLFGVVYYSYWSTSENKMHYEHTVSETIKEDSLPTRSQQERLLSDLSKDCGPVGASVTITEKKIVTADNKEDARYKKIRIGQDIILNGK